MLSVIAPAYLSGMGLVGWQASEDLLTAEFFGLLRYLSIDTAVLPILDRASTARGTTFSSWFSELRGPRPTRLGVSLWRELDDKGIPDVIMHLGDNQGTALLDILVEVKLYSGQSERAGDDRPQLARYLSEFAKASSFASRRCVVYITLGRSCPGEELMAAERASAVTEAPLFWLGWHEIAAVLHGISSFSAASLDRDGLVVRDLQGVLRARGIRSDAEFEHFPLLDAQPLPDLWNWLEQWPLGKGPACP